MSEDTLDPYLKREKVYDDFLQYILPQIRERKALDIGCGDGRYLKYFSPESVGIELDDRRRNIAIGTGLFVLSQDINQGLKFDSDSFEAVFCSHVLEHVDSPVLLLKEIRRVLQSNGILVLGLPTKGSLLEKLWFRTDYYRDHDHLYCFDIEDISNLLAKTRYEVLQAYIGYHLFPFLGKIFNLNKYSKSLFWKVETHYWVIAKNTKWELI